MKYFNPSFSTSVRDSVSGRIIPPRWIGTFSDLPDEALLQSGALIPLQGGAEMPVVEASSQPIQVASAPLMLEDPTEGGE